MNNNRPLIITLIVILSILAVSVIGLLILLLTNNFSFNFNGFDNVSDVIILDEYYGNKYSLVDIENTLGDVEIINSEDDRIRVVVYGEEELLTVKDDSSLAIEYRAKPCIGICFNQPSSRIELYIPDSYEEEIKIRSKAGDIKIADYELAIFNIESDLGDINIGNVNKLDIMVHAGDLEANTVNRITAENDLGDIKINNINEYLDISNNCGDIEIGNANITENSKIYNALGDITVRNTNDIRIEATVKLGDNKVDENNSKSDISLKIDNKCGDVEVN